MKSLGRILVFTKKLTPYYIIIVVASLFVTAAGIAVPFIIGRATDAAVAAVAGTVSITQATTTVLWLAGAFFAVDVLSTMISSVGGYFGDIMSQKMRAILSVRYYEKLLTLPQQYFDNELTGTITSRLNRSITEVTGFAKYFANNFFTTILTVVAVLAISEKLLSLAHTPACDRVPRLHVADGPHLAPLAASRRQEKRTDRSRRWSLQ